MSAPPSSVNAAGSGTAVILALKLLVAPGRVAVTTTTWVKENCELAGVAPPCVEPEKLAGGFEKFKVDPIRPPAGVPFNVLVVSTYAVYESVWVGSSVPPM